MKYVRSFVSLCRKLLTSCRNFPKRYAFLQQDRRRVLTVRCRREGSPNGSLTSFPMATYRETPTLFSNAASRLVSSWSLGLTATTNRAVYRNTLSVCAAFKPRRMACQLIAV